MIPAHFELLGEMPCTRAASWTKNRLPDVVIEAGKRDAAVIRPVTELEKRITAIWEDVLGVTDLGHDPAISGTWAATRSRPCASSCA